MKNFLSNTKGNFPRNSKKQGVIRDFAVLALIVFVILFFGKGVLGSLVSFVTTPFYFARHYIETSSATIPVFIRSRLELENQIHDLQQKIESGQGTETTLGYVMEENRELRALLSASSSPRIVAGVIAQPPFSPYDTFILDKGSLDGIVVSAPVYYGSGQIIGYVREVNDRHSYVRLFSSPGVEASAYVFGPNIFTRTYGEGGGVIHMSIPQGITIELGDIVVMPSLDTGVLGKITEIQSIPTEPEQHAYITFDIPLRGIRLVSVGTTPVQKITFDEAQKNVGEAEKKLFEIELPPDYVASSTPNETVGTTSVSNQIP